MQLTKIILALIVWTLHAGNFCGFPSAGMGVEGGSIMSADDFSCYECDLKNVDSPSAQCSADDLKPCSFKQCQKSVSRSDGGKYTVSRICGLGLKVGCSKNCDDSQPDVACLLCCEESGCNTAFRSLQPAVLLISISTVLALLWPVYVR